MFRKITPEEFEHAIATRECENFQHLRLICFRISMPPDELTLFSSITHLDLSGCGLVTIDTDALCSLVRLVSLHVNDNELTELPNGLSQMRHLRSMGACNNKIESILSLCNMTTLGQIYLQHNKINHVPDEIVQLRGLTKLNLRDNPISVIPEAFLELPLIEFYMCGCKIREIPAYVGKNKHTILTTSRNPIERAHILSRANIDTLSNRELQRFDEYARLYSWVLDALDNRELRAETHEVLESLTWYYVEKYV